MFTFYAKNTKRLHCLTDDVNDQSKQAFESFVDYARNFQE